MPPAAHRPQRRCCSGAPGGIRTPDLLIRSHCQGVQRTLGQASRTSSGVLSYHHNPDARWYAEWYRKQPPPARPAGRRGNRDRRDGTGAQAVDEGLARSDVHRRDILNRAPPAAVGLAPTPRATGGLFSWPARPRQRPAPPRVAGRSSESTRARCARMWIRATTRTLRSWGYPQ